MIRIKDWSDVGSVPEEPCEYKLFDGDELIRNGSSCNCKRRLKEHRRSIAEATGFKVRLTRSCEEARALEKAACNASKPRLNKRCG
jgi:hypothetical protein